MSVVCVRHLWNNLTVFHKIIRLQLPVPSNRMNTFVLKMPAIMCGVRTCNVYAAMRTDTFTNLVY